MDGGRGGGGQGEIERKGGEGRRGREEGWTGGDREKVEGERWTQGR